MWLWPTFAKNDARKRAIITLIAIALAIVLLFGVAPLARGSMPVTLGALAVFAVLALLLRFVPPTIRLRTIRDAATTHAEEHPGGDLLIANVVQVPLDRPITSREPYRTRILQLTADELSLWNPDDLSAPVLAVPRADVVGADPDSASPARLRITVAPRSGGQGFVLSVTLFRPTGSRPATRETVVALAQRLLRPRPRVE